MTMWCDQQYVQRVASAALPRCRELSLLLPSAVPAQDAIAALCASQPCLAALRDIRALGLGDCELSSALDASARSLQRDVVDVCLGVSSSASSSVDPTALDATRLSTGAVVGLAMTLAAVVMALVLVCAWVRRSRRKHPLQLLSPTKKRGKRTSNGVAGSGIGKDVPYVAIELSEEELRLQATGNK